MVGSTPRSVPASRVGEGPVRVGEVDQAALLEVHREAGRLEVGLLPSHVEVRAAARQGLRVGLRAASASVGMLSRKSSVPSIIAALPFDMSNLSRPATTALTFAVPAPAFGARGQGSGKSRCGSRASHREPSEPREAWLANIKAIRFVHFSSKKLAAQTSAAAARGCRLAKASASPSGANKKNAYDGKTLASEPNYATSC